jgi:hypothetical protein
LAMVVTSFRPDGWKRLTPATAHGRGNVGA